MNGGIHIKSEMEQLAKEYMKDGVQKLKSNKLNQALLLIQNALHLSEAAGNMQMYAKNLNIMGVIYGVIGNEAMSINYYLEGLECAIAHEYHDVIMLLYNNIGSRYQKLGEHEKAVQYFQKAESEIHNQECKDAIENIQRYLVTCLNLAGSYIELGKHLLAKKYVDRVRTWMEENRNNVYWLTYKVTEWRLCWETDRKAYVKEEIKEVLDDVMQGSNAADYMENVIQVCRLLCKMKEYEKWKYVILTFENVVKEMESIYYRLVLAEMWMEFYQATDEKELYMEYCVKHAQLCQQQKIISNKERATAIDIKIELREAVAEIKRVELRTYTDSLTGIGNRYKLEEDVKKSIEDACALQRTMAFGFVDVDCFKELNDTYGHIRGDECLVRVAEILQNVMEGKGFVYRFGGDEFVLLIEDGEMENVSSIAKNIKENLHRIKMDNMNSSVLPEITVSQGFASFIPKCGIRQEEVLRYADEALYMVKERGKNGYYILCK